MTSPILASYEAINGQNLPRCPRVDHDRVHWLNIKTGEMRWDACRTLKCEVCFPGELKRCERAIAHGGTSGRPEWFIRLTLDGDNWPRTRQKFADLPRLLKEQGFPGWQHSYVIHQGGEGRFHAHALVKCVKTTQVKLSTQLERTWGSGVHVQAVYDQSGAAHYFFHDCNTHAQTIRHLAMNGGRPQHNSRGYFGEWTFRQTKGAVAPHSDEWRKVFTNSKAA